MLRLTAKTDIQLIEVTFQKFAGLLDPNPGNVVDGFQLLHIIQPGKEDLTVDLGESDAHIRMIGLVFHIGIMLPKLTDQLLKTAVAQSASDFTADEKAMTALIDGAFQDLASGENRFTAAAPALQHQITGCVLKKRQKGFVAGFRQILFFQCCLFFIQQNLPPFPRRSFLSFSESSLSPSDAGKQIIRALFSSTPFLCGAFSAPGRQSVLRQRIL